MIPKEVAAVHIIKVFADAAEDAQLVVMEACRLLADVINAY